MKKLIKKYQDWRTKRFIKKLKRACANMNEEDILYMPCALLCDGTIISKANPNNPKKKK